MHVHATAFNKILSDSGSSFFLFSFFVQNSDRANNFADDECLSTLAYMADIFTILNELNTSFQGPNKTIFNMLDKVAAFKLKLDLWIHHVGEERWSCLRSCISLS